MPRPANWDKSYNFGVEIDDVVHAGFNSIGGLEMTFETIEYHEGGRLHPIKMPGKPTFGTVTAKRGHAKSDSDLWDWMQSLYDVKKGTGKPYPDAKRTVDIIQYDRDGKDICKWTLNGAWIKTYRLPEEWNADNNAILLEEVEIEYDHFTREEL